jgi:hypothetical protein
LENHVKTTAVIFLFCCAALFLAGCYSSPVVELDEGPPDSLNPREIDYILTRDAGRVEFDATPTVTEGAIIGVSNGASLTIPFSDISSIQLKRSFDGTTTFLTGAVAVLLGVVVGVAAGGN